MSDPPVVFDEDGLIPVVIQDDQSGAVLMLAFMNETALEATRSTGKTHFWSRSRKSLWRKGETSGHEQIVKSIHVNCYENSLLIKVDQLGACCHTGFPTCFYRELTNDDELIETVDRHFDPEAVYGDHQPVPVSVWVGAYRWLADRDLVSISGTSRLLHESSVPVLSARVADELRELAGVLSGDHRHEDMASDALLEGSQVLYWMVLSSMRAGLSDEEIVEAVKTGTSDDDAGPVSGLPPLLRELADEWQRAFFRSVMGQMSKTVSLVSVAAEAANTSLRAMIDRDLAELGSRPYLQEYFATVNT
jgi:phosphoribosyl-AMP cyclohydrolase